jgi:hypothetical protein
MNNEHPASCWSAGLCSVWLEKQPLFGQCRRTGRLKKEAELPGETPLPASEMLSALSDVPIVYRKTFD